MRTLFDEASERVSCRELAERVLGRAVIEREGDAWACCPFHPERTPSLRLYPDRFWCYGCGLNGGVVELARLHLEAEGGRVSHVQAARWLLALDLPPAGRPE